MFEVLEITGPKMNALYGVAGISAALKRADIASVALPIVAAGYQASLVAIENNCPDFAGRPTNWQKFADETKDIFEMYQIQARKP